VTKKETEETFVYSKQRGTEVVTVNVVRIPFCEEIYDIRQQRRRYVGGLVLHEAEERVVRTPFATAAYHCKEMLCCVFPRKRIHSNECITTPTEQKRV